MNGAGGVVSDSSLSHAISQAVVFHVSACERGLAQVSCLQSHPPPLFNSLISSQFHTRTVPPTSYTRIPHHNGTTTLPDRNGRSRHSNNQSSKQAFPPISHYSHTHTHQPGTPLSHRHGPRLLQSNNNLPLPTPPRIHPLRRHPRQRLRTNTQPLKPLHERKERPPRLLPTTTTTIPHPKPRRLTTSLCSPTTIRWPGSCQCSLRLQPN